MAQDTPVPLSPEDSARLTDFARAFKAAARSVVLYPSGHPAITATLARMVQLTARETLPAPLRISVLLDTLLLDDRAPTRPDAAIGELAVILHSHVIGEMLVHPGSDVDNWRTFLLLLGRSPDEVRTEGGIARLWTTMTGRYIELREVDYAEVLRERDTGEEAAWETVIANCLQGDHLTEEAIRLLLAASGDPDKLAALITDLDTKAKSAGRGIGGRTSALIRLLKGIVEAVTGSNPDELEPVMQNLGTAVAQLTPEMMVALLTHVGGPKAEGGDVVSAVVDRMSEQSIVGFVARNAMQEDSSIDRVAQAFQTLVQDSDKRERLLTLAHDEAATSPLGQTAGFEDVWNKVAQKVMTSYSDKPFVSDEYARELSISSTPAIEVDQIHDDPPERMARWLDSVATTELRKLDLTLVLDLLRIEEEPDDWAEMMRPVVALLNDLFLVGDFEAAEALLDALVSQTQPDREVSRRQTAVSAVDTLVTGPMMRHINAHLSSLDDGQFARVKTMCVSLGEVLIRPLAETLSAEDRRRPRERLTTILIAFGAIGRLEVERLKGSANAAVRRTAVYLLREFGGHDALPDLAELLDDHEPGVQRQAVRAILNIGTEQAYQILEQALASGTPRSREAIMQAVGSLRDERAGPLFVYILGHVDHRGTLGWVYARAIESLGALRDPDGVAALKEALYRGEWWAPRRTATLRSAAAAALARIGTTTAVEALEEAVHRAPRRIRAAARAHLRAGPHITGEAIR
jgi:HEAT repeats/PBS lyase HEAT-like repeat